MATSSQNKDTSRAGPGSDAAKEESKQVQASFVCQKCRQPLQVDPAFYNLDRATYAELTAPLVSSGSSGNKNYTGLDSHQLHGLTGGNGSNQGEEGFEQRLIPPLRRLISTDSGGGGGGNGFTLVGNGGGGSSSQEEGFAHRFMVTAELFDIVSGQSEVDHPLCEECTDGLLDTLDQQLQATEEECKDYRDFLEQMHAKGGGGSEEEQDTLALEEELKQLNLEGVALQKELGEVEAERKEVQKRIAKEKEIVERLVEEEKLYWRKYAEYKQQAVDLEDDKRSVDNQLKYAQVQLEKLRKTNVFNATFHIWHSGHFGTINNFRLGRLPNDPVPWEEINTAWGQTVLLLHSLCKKMNLNLQRYRLVPFGNHSFIESLDDKSRELPLYGSGGIRFFWDTKFDQAMVAFLDCLQQFKEAVEKDDSGFCLPYRMEKGRIEESDPVSNTSYSIKIQFNSEEQWTKALKFMLTNLKWGLAWVSAQFANK